MLNKLAYDVILFEKCNLKCKHCFEQNHRDDWNIDDVMQLPAKIEASFIDQYENRNSVLDQLTISLCGGELFIDGFDNTRFDVYKRLIEEITRRIRNHYNGPISFEMISNGVFTKINRVETFLKETQSKISISYDPVHRYKSSKQKQLVLDNIRHFKDAQLLDEISITLTKQSIDYYVDNDDLNQFNDIDIGINYYIISNPNCVDLMPSDDDYWRFWQYCYQNQYYNVKALKQFEENIYHNVADSFCICENRLIVRNGVITYNCAIYSTCYNNTDFYNNCKVNESTIRFVKKTSGQSKRGCIYCQYNNICPGVCWASTLHKDNVVSDTCPNYRLIEMIKNDE